MDYSGKDLSGDKAKLNNSTFICCNFNNTNLRYTDCSNSKFYGCTFIGTDCNHTNFANSIIGSVFKPKDALGMIVSLECKTFRGMRVSPLWWYCFQQFSLLMDVEKEKDGTDPKDKLIQALGIQRYLALKNMFREREI